MIARQLRTVQEPVFCAVMMAVCAVGAVRPGWAAGGAEAPLPVRRVQALYDHHEKRCLQKGWQKL